MNVLVLLMALCAGVDDANQEDIVFPQDYSSAGLNSFFVVCRLFDVQLDLESSVSLLGRPGQQVDGHSFEELASAADAVGLHAIGLQSTCFIYVNCRCRR